MNDAECVSFLQWALPRMGMRWKGFRKVRRQVCRRIRRRMVELGVSGPEEYRERLQEDPEEWDRLAVLCRVTISRFCRDRGVYRFLSGSVLPVLAVGTSRFRAWSAGCASGEEPYTLNLLWHLEVAPRFPEVKLEILATDVDPTVLDRARRARYPGGSLRELDPDWVERGFVEEDGVYRLRPEFRKGVEFREEDLRSAMPPGPFHLILCRNLVFTYFDEDEQARLLARLLERLLSGGALVLGAHERLPPGDWPLERWSSSEPVYRKVVTSPPPS
jgi:chemotaxis protein methyltransferase CheR